MMSAATIPIVYSDLNCPFSFALNEWLDQRGWSTDVHWRGVEHEPSLPLRAAPTAGEQGELTEEVVRVQERDPSLALARPGHRPASGPALALVAAIADDRPDDGAALRTELFRALWQRGEDIASAAVLDRLASQFGIDADARSRGGDVVAGWTAEWRAAAYDRIPVIAAPTGTTYLGLGEPRLLEAFLGSALFDIRRTGTSKVRP